MIKLVFSLCMAFLLCQCTDIEINQDELDQIKTEMSNTAFSTKFWAEVERSNQDKNYFLSPTSLQLALGMLLNGAGGTTKNEIKTALDFSSLNDETINQNFKNLQAALPSIDKNVKLSIANAIWARQDFPIAKTFSNTSQDIFKAEIASLPFDATTVNKINAWADKNTNGKIKKVLDRISDNDVMLLMNALYFKGDWSKPFDKNATSDEDFMGSLKTSSIKMMNKNENVSYLKNASFSAIELPYGKDGNFNMVLILPNDPANYKTLINSIDINNLNFAEKKVLIKIPKFTLDYELTLNQVLKNLGIKSAFTEQADLNGLVEGSISQKLLLSFVKQNTFLAVDEVGTEAAAVTTIGVGVTSAPVDPTTFYCNRPFYFLIREKQTGQTLFFGGIKNL